MSKFRWFTCISRYNTMMDTDYKDSRELLEALYRETKSVAKMEILLDCHHIVIREEMDRLKIPRRKSFANKIKEIKIRAIPKEKIKELYIEEIAEMCSCSKVFVNVICRRHSLIIKRRPVGQRR
jgi:hypothetical protein